jgi:prevent-host-death family protein
MVDQEATMLDVTLADAKERLGELIERVERGEMVQILRDGKPVVRIEGIEVRNDKPRKPIDIEALRALTDSMPMQDEPADVFIRRMRDDARY